MASAPHDSDRPDDPLPPDLRDLRERLKRARAERGACPAWEELRADLLPGGGARSGRAVRIAHRELCPYCDAHVREWKRSFDRTADTLEAIERGVARGLVQGARDLAGRMTTLSRKSVAADAPAEPPLPSLTPLLPPPPALRAPPAPRARAPIAQPSAAPTLAQAIPAPGLLVVESMRDYAPPDAVFLCAGALGLEVACVERIEELLGDPDLADVRAIVIASDRPVAEWPQAVRWARGLVPGRPVVVLATFGQEPPQGARRALGDALLSAAVTPEELLVALDPRLR